MTRAPLQGLFIPVDPWIALLQQGDTDAAWDVFIGRHRRLIIAAIRHYARDYDDVMNVFAHACESLREDDFRRLRAWTSQQHHTARFSTWLVVVIRNLTADWFRRRDGRKRLPALAGQLPPLQRRLFELVILEHHGHSESYELLRAADPTLSYRAFQHELRAVYQALAGKRKGALLPELTETPLAETELAGPEEDWSLERTEALERAMATLRAEDRVIVQLYVIDQLPAEAVARIAGLPNAKAAYNHAYRALAALRQSLEAAGFRRGDL